MKKLLIMLLVINAGFGAEVALQSSIVNNSFISEPYKPLFVINNEGDETLLVEAVLTNISLTFSPSPTNPATLLPGEAGLFSFEFESLECSDYLRTYHPIFNLSYNTSTTQGNLTINFNFTVKSPLSISVQQSINDPLPVSINSFETLLIQINNEGLAVHYFNFSKSQQNLFINYLINEDNYFNDELLNQNFNVRPIGSEIIKLTIIPSVTGMHDFELNITGLECSNITDSISFTINSFTGRQSVFGIARTPSTNSLSLIMLILLTLIFVYRKLNQF